MKTFVWTKKGKPIVVAMGNTKEEAKQVVRAQARVEYHELLNDDVNNLIVLKPNAVMVIK